MLKAYLEKYPEGEFRKLAEINLAKPEKEGSNSWFSPRRAWT